MLDLVVGFAIGAFCGVTFPAVIKAIWAKVKPFIAGLRSKAKAVEQTVTTPKSKDGQ